jgi:hypothetical protein
MKMGYVLHTSKVVAGAVTALLAYGLATDTFVAAVTLLYGMVFLLGLFLAVHGLFTGVEAAVAAGVADGSEGTDAS